MEVRNVRVESDPEKIGAIDIRLLSGETAIIVSNKELAVLLKLLDSASPQLNMHAGFLLNLLNKLMRVQRYEHPN